MLVAAGVACAMPAVSGCSGGTEPQPGLQQLWFAAQPAGVVRSRPAVVGGSVIFGSADGAVIARDPASGSQQWRTPVYGAGEIAGADLLPAGDRVIVIGTREAAALSVATGTVLWRYAPPVDSRGSGLPGYLELTHAAISNQTLFLPAWGASLSAVDVATGAQRWSWRLPRLASDTAAADFRSGAAGATVSGDTVYVSVWHNRNAAGGLRESMLVALERATGVQLWTKTLPLEGEGTSVQAAPIVLGSRVFVPTINGYVYAIDRFSQSIEWTFRSAGFVYSTQSQPAFSGDTLFVDGGDEKLYALRASTGAVVWSTAAVPATTDLVATNSRIYLSDYGRLIVLDKANGKVVERWQSDSGADGLQSAAVAKGTQIFATRAAGAWSFREP